MQRQPTPHPTQTKTPEQITCREILVLYDRPLNDSNPKNRLVLHICQWSRQDHPVLEVRRCYICKDGTRRWYKQVGLSLDVLRVIAEHQTEIVAALQS